MRRFSRGLAAAVVALAALAFMATPARADSSQEADFVSRINAVRASHGAGPLSVNGTLTSVARNWAGYMAGQGAISHNPNLSSQAPSDWTRLGENVGMGPSVDSIEQAFINSSHHFENMINPAFTSIGVGVVASGGSLYVTEDYMTGGYAVSAPAPRSNPTPTVVHRAAPVAKSVTNSVKAVTAPPAAPAPAAAAVTAPPAPPAPSPQMVQALAGTEVLSHLSAPSPSAILHAAAASAQAGAGYRAPVVAHPATRPISRSIAVGFVVALLVTLIGVATVALPLFAFARVTEPEHGLNRPFVHTGLVDVAIPAGVVAGAVTGAVAARAYRKGTKLPQPTSFYEDAR
jgi:hypothetical protein